ncbi:MAG: PBP1A family penicillin-binding protein [Spirochaetales bacterium]|nr:PBP1A family penicillin-binding protein [Spirochaetales bacterium]
MKIDRNRILMILFGLTVAVTVFTGITLGIAIAGVVNNMNDPEFGKIKMPVSSKIYDIKGRLITELFAEQKREIVSIHDMPPFLIQALLTREDREFYSHNGFNLISTFRAAIMTLSGGHVQGASTITQQLAGLLYADRSERTVLRKIVELWYALQLEKKLSKDEILELYLNQMYFGHGCYGVEAAAKFHFGHSVRELTPAEAVMLVIQLANWNEYSPRKKPTKAKKMQETILDDMVALGYIEKEPAKESFHDYWANFDITQSSGGAFLLREDHAPYFTSYVQKILDEEIFGDLNIFQDGLEIYTTLNLDYQAVAQDIMKTKLDEINKDYEKELENKVTGTDSFYLPMIDLIGLSFNMPHLHVDKHRHMIETIEEYSEIANPTVDMVSSMFGFKQSRAIAKSVYQWKRDRSKVSSIQGALVCIDPYTGYIYAMVGGREFNSENQINYATMGFVHPGSAFKPILYSAALEDRAIMPSTILKDSQIYFEMPGGDPYIPNNYGGVYNGDVPARDAIAKSLNIPSIKVLEMIGFDSAISMASRLLDVKDPNEIQKIFPRYWSLALGVVNTSPLKMSQAFSAFSNGGRGVTPLGILYVKDRNGKVILDLEKKRLADLRQQGLPQLMKPETAYLMQSMLISSGEYGTVSFAKKNLNDMKYPFGGKTGTTQNWHDAWTVGISPYYTTAVWFGFDKGGGSLGINRTGASLASPAWGTFMNEIHKQMDKEKQEQNKTYSTLFSENPAVSSLSSQRMVELLAQKQHLPPAWVSHIQQNHTWVKPDTLVEVAVCRDSGQLPSPYCPQDRIRNELFYQDNIPETECSYHRDLWIHETAGGENINRNFIEGAGVTDITDSGLPDPRSMPKSFEEFEKNPDKGLTVEDSDPDKAKIEKDEALRQYLLDD